LKRHAEAGAVFSQVFNTHIGEAFPAPSRAISGRIFDSLLAGNLMCVHSVLIRKEALKKTGYFDESLSAYEDWDLWLRLSFHFPFVFVPGLVAVYFVSPRGLWQSGVGEKENTERVITKALTMLPDSPRYAELKRTVRARTALEYGRTWAEVLAALRQFPFIIRYSWARHRVSRWMRRLALRSDAPLSTLQKLSSEMKEAAMSDAHVRNRRAVRQTVAKSWAGMASSLAARPALRREAAYAASRAVALAPSLLVRGALAPIIARGAFGVESARSSEPTGCGN
jgi:glycosyl transferase family 2